MLIKSRVSIWEGDKAPISLSAVLVGLFWFCMKKGGN